MENKIWKSILVIFCVIGITHASAQTIRTVVIDTLIGYNYGNDFDIPIIRSIPNRGDELLVNKAFNPKINISKKHPNVIITGVHLNDIALLLDNKGGLLKLFSLDKILGDTININKWEVYKNGLTDTIRTSTAYFQMYNDSMADKPYKVKSTFRLLKNTGKKNIHGIEITINRKLYIIPVEITAIQSMFPTTFNGYMPKKKYQLFNQSSKVKSKRIYRYKVFMGEEITLIQCFESTLDLDMYK